MPHKSYVISTNSLVVYGSSTIILFYAKEKLFHASCQLKPKIRSRRRNFFAPRHCSQFRIYFGMPNTSAMKKVAWRRRWLKTPQFQRNFYVKNKIYLAELLFIIKLRTRILRWRNYSNSFDSNGNVFPLPVLYKYSLSILSFSEKSN